MNESTEDLKPGEGQTPEDVNSQAGSLEASSNDVTPEQAEEAKRKSQEDINRATNKAINRRPWRISPSSLMCLWAMSITTSRPKTIWQRR